MQWRNGEEVARIQLPDAERIQSRLAFHAAEIAHELHVIAMPVGAVSFKVLCAS
jgi:hypothetical protein